MTVRAASATNAAPAGNSAPAPAPAAAPAAAPKTGYERPAVYLDDLPVVGQPQPGAQPGKPAAPAPDPAAAPVPSVVDGQPDPENPDNAAPLPETGQELVAVTGRKFKDSSELLKSYNESSKEAQRLVSASKAAEAKAAMFAEQLDMANKAFLELHGQIGAGVFPGLKQADGTYVKEVTADSDEETRMNFYAEKRDWQKKQETLKKALDDAKNNADAYANQTKEVLARTSQSMVADPVSFPDFEAVADIRADIVRQSPYLDNKAETPYTTYLMALGVRALQERKAVTKAEADSHAAAAAQAQGAAASSASAGAAPAGARGSKAQDDALDRVVKTYKKRASYS